MSSEILLLPFKDLPIGTRFKYPGEDETWIILHTLGTGLIIRWDGLYPKPEEKNLTYRQFVDEVSGWTLDSKVEVASPQYPNRQYLGNKAFAEIINGELLIYLKNEGATKKYNHIYLNNKAMELLIDYYNKAKNNGDINVK